MKTETNPSFINSGCNWIFEKLSLLFQQLKQPIIFQLLLFTVKEKVMVFLAEQQ